jgi:hypothetical protein
MHIVCLICLAAISGQQQLKRTGPSLPPGATAGEARFRFTIQLAFEIAANAFGQKLEHLERKMGILRRQHLEAFGANFGV